MTIPALIAIPIRAVMLACLLAYLAVGTVVVVAWSGGAWFWNAVRDR